MSKVRSLVGNRLKSVRLMRGMKQGTIAEIVGCDVNTISRYETGKAMPGIEQLLKLAEALDVSPAELLPPTGAAAQRLILVRKQLHLKARQVNSAEFLENLVLMLDEEIAKQRNQQT